MKKYHLTTLSSIALAACLAAASSAYSQTYTVTDLGVLPGKKMSVPAAINNMGQVVGTSFSSEDDASAFLYNYNGGDIQDLGNTISGSVSRAFGINANGVAVGFSTFGGKEPTNHAAMFAKGSAADLGVLNGMTQSFAQGVNSAEQVVGYCNAKPDSNLSRAFLWTANRGMLDLGTLGGNYSQALSINDSGSITGNAATPKGVRHAFLIEANPKASRFSNGMIDLGTLGGDSSYGTSINAYDHVAGYSTTPDGRTHAFLYSETMQDLGSLGGKSPDSDQSYALSVNAIDQVVGYTFLPVDKTLHGSMGGPSFQLQQVAFISFNGVMSNLNDLVGGAAKEFLIYSATGINDKGQIVGNAYEYSSGTFHAVLLTPLLVYQPQHSVRNAKR